MRKFVLEEMLLMSPPERTARKIKFHPKTTVLLGGNDTGKSSLIKSIYWTFGAEPARVHPEWKKLDVVCVVRFTVDGKKFSILRQGNFFALFDELENLINKYTSITKELGPELSEIFNFNIRITNRQGKEVIPPPAYYLLPFYIDQDVSWTENWKGFAGLEYLSHWRTPIIEYHTGLKSAEDYQLKIQKDKINLLIQGLSSERVVYDRALSGVVDEEGAVSFDLNVNEFKKEIADLMEKVGTLQEYEEKLKLSLVDKLNHRNTILSQINVVSRALEEAKNDYEFAQENIEVECPTCGQHYSNSFAERFSIAQDEYRCSELLLELHQELIDLNADIEENQSEYSSKNKTTEELVAVLSQKRGQLTLGGLIKNEGRKQVKAFLRNKLEEIDAELGGYLMEVKVIEKNQRKQLAIEENRRSRIKQEYLRDMKNYLEELNVTKLSEDSYSKISTKITETGSDTPRALLAYFYAILNLISGYSSSVFAPIIIDSPKQQDPDTLNWKKVLNFIKNRRVEGSQLIFSSSDLGNVKFDGKIVELTEKYKLLSKDEFPEIFDEINLLFKKSLLE